MAFSRIAGSLDDAVCVRMVSNRSRDPITSVQGFGARRRSSTHSRTSMGRSRTDLRSITAKGTTKLFEKHFPGEPLTATLHDTFYSEDYADWSELRNILAHRIASGRTVHMTMQGATTPPPPNRWTSVRPAPARPGYSARVLPPLEITEQGLVPRRRWLASRMDAVLSAAHEFVAKHL
jgi:hypothetical protein